MHTAQRLYLSLAISGNDRPLSFFFFSKQKITSQNSRYKHILHSRHTRGHFGDLAAERVYLLHYPFSNAEFVFFGKKQEEMATIIER